MAKATGKSEESLRKETRLLKKRVLKFIAIGMKHVFIPRVCIHGGGLR